VGGAVNRLTWSHDGVSGSIDLGAAVDISIAVRFSAPTVDAFSLPQPTSAAVVAGGFVGDVRRGGSCNCEMHHFSPHAAGTHTEGPGHILADRRPITSENIAPMMLCAFLRITPVPLSSCSDEVGGNHHPHDAVVDELSLQTAWDALPALPYRAVAIATADGAVRRHEHHSRKNPPYLTSDAMSFLRRHDIDHLLVDLPSVDREDDGGLLSAHRTFFDLPSTGPIASRTITEFIAVDATVRSGAYVVMLQVSAFDADAAPSRPLLFALQP
jgi:arylformamidase